MLSYVYNFFSAVIWNLASFLIIPVCELLLMLDFICLYFIF